MVELVRSGRKPSELSKEFGCHTTTILSWVRQSAGSCDATTPTNAAPLSAKEREKLVELRRKYRQLQQERDILAKACVHGLPTTARRRSHRLRVDSSQPGRTPRTSHVPALERLYQWLLRLARSRTE
jgi:transposase